MPISRRIRTLAAATIAVGLPLTLAACGGGGDDEANAGATASGGVQIIQDGKLTVCTHLSYKPFQFNEGGRTVGFDVDIVDLAAKKMGLTQEIVNIEFQQIWSGAAFKAKKCDIGAAGMTITPEREKSVAFAKPYFDATQALLVKKGDPTKSLADLKGKKLGVQTETTGQVYAEQQKDANGYTPVVFDDLPLSLNALKAGRADAVINDNGVLYDYAKDNPDTEVVAEFATGEHYGIAAKRDDENAAKILQQVDAAIDEARQNGTYDEIYKKWFGTTPGAAPQGGASPSASASS